MSSSTYERITQAIIQQLESGTAPWRKGWSSTFQFPRNACSLRKYSGVNVFLLSGQRYESPLWLTYRQAQELGGHVKKGEKSTPIVYFNLLEREDAETGEVKRIPLYKLHHVFNVSQTADIPAKNIPVIGARREFNPIANCERIAASMPKRPEVLHGYSQACYSPSLDVVRMPDPSSFEKPEGYYSVLWHELGHSTGHRSRLNREGIENVAAFGSEVYSREELVAEMTAAFLCGETGIETATLPDSAAYVAGWLKVLRGDSRLVIQAAASAQRAANYILGTDSACADKGVDHD